MWVVFLLCGSSEATAVPDVHRLNLLPELSLSSSSSSDITSVYASNRTDWHCETLNLEIFKALVLLGERDELFTAQ
jgi:hypothetical protein